MHQQNRQITQFEAQVTNVEKEKRLEDMFRILNHRFQALEHLLNQKPSRKLGPTAREENPLTVGDSLQILIQRKEAGEKSVQGSKSFDLMASIKFDVARIEFEIDRLCDCVEMYVDVGGDEKFVSYVRSYFMNFWLGLVVAQNEIYSEKAKKFFVR